MSALWPDHASWRLPVPETGESLLALALGLAALGAVWLVTAAVRGIVSEYAKRFWFKRVHRGEFEKAKAEHARARMTLADERAEFDAVKVSVETLLLENERLLGRNLALAAENASLRQRRRSAA